jgi:HlyD family secretion protein
MQRPPNDHKPRLSRGASRRQSDEAAFLDGVIPPQEQLPQYRDEPVRNYNSIAVVVGKKPGSQRQAPQRPVSQKYPIDHLDAAGQRQAPPKPVPPRPVSQRPVSQKYPIDHLDAAGQRRQAPPKPTPPRPVSQKPLPQRPVSQQPRLQKAMPPRPAPRDPPRSAAPRLPALREQAGAPATRTAPGSVAVLKRAYGAVFNPEDHHPAEAEQDGLKAYLVQSFENQRRTGGRVLAVALLVGGGWATLMPLSGAVVVPGTVVSESSVKKIQHQTGGIIAAIGVMDGMHVKQGDVLVRLDDTQVRTNYEQLRSKIAQLNEEIGGTSAQIKSRQTQSDLIAQELDGVQQLWDKRLVPLSRLTGLQRDAARIDGEKAQLVFSIAETRGKINESEIQLAAAKDQVAHIDLRAPVNGVVHQLAVHTVGGVVTPAEVMMVIVPEGDELQIDAHLPPDQIDQVRKGQNAQVRFPAFNQRTTPEIAGVVSHVSADITRDAQQPQSNPGYYTVRISLPGQEFARLGDRQLIAGMPAEVFVQTGSRTMMSYMFKPITEQLGRMFRER